MSFWILVCVMITSFIVTEIVRRTASKHLLLDIPNERSSHSEPTPRGGGIGFVTAFLAFVAFMAVTRNLETSLAAAFLLGGTLIAVVGFIDDRYNLSPYVRMAMQMLVGVVSVILIGGMPPLELGFARIEWGIFGDFIAVIGIVWLINLYNFMDGIDGLAAAEAIITTGVVAAFYLGSPLFVSAADILRFSALNFAVAAACLGFLVWNWSPARIFMGDVGSGFLGFVLALLALTTAKSIPHLLWVWLILLAVFVVDTLVTLVNRLRYGRKWHEAHRSHAYQHATTRYGSHRRVTLSILLINLIWLSPLAWLALNNPAWVLPTTIIAYVPLFLLAFYFKAGVEPYEIDVAE